MAADFNKPVTTDNYIDLLAMLRDNQEVLARMFATGTTATNIPVGSVRFGSGKFQTWSGSAWVDVPVSIDGGGTGAQSAEAARVALGADNAANLTEGVLDAARVPGLDAGKIVSGTLTRDTSGNAATATYATSAGSAESAPWSGITGKPAVIAAGATQQEARDAIGAISGGVQTLWTGNSSSVNLNSLPGGYPGDGLYVFTMRSPGGAQWNALIYYQSGTESEVLTRFDHPSSPSGDTRVYRIFIATSGAAQAIGRQWASGATFGQDTSAGCSIVKIQKVI